MSDSSATPPGTAPEWLLLACAHCGSPLKVRAERLGSHLQCPACHGVFTAVADTGEMPPPLQPEPRKKAPLKPAPPDLTSPPKRPAEPPRPVAAPTAPKRPLPEGDDLISEENPEIRVAPGHVPPSSFDDLAVDRLAGSQFRAFDDPEFAIPPEGIRVRKRKRRRRDAEKEAPEWEADLPEAMPAPAAADGWQEVTTLAVAAGEDGAERRKRIRRRRVPKGLEKLWLGASRAASWVLIGLGALIFVGLIAGAIYLVRSHDSPPEPVASTTSQDVRPAFTSLSEGDAAARVVEGFLAASTVEAKAKYVRFPDKVLPLMQAWYRTHSPAPQQAVRDELETALTKFVYAGDRKFLILAMKMLPDLKHRFFSVEILPDGSQRLDWETSVGWQPIPLEEFKLARPQEPVPYRVYVAEGDYYNGPFADSDKWLCCQLTYPSDADFKLLGYVDRGTEAGALLADTFSAGGSASLIVSLSFPAEGGDPDQVILHEVLHQTWFLPDGPATSAAKPAAPAEK